VTRRKKRREHVLLLVVFTFILHFKIGFQRTKTNELIEIILVINNSKYKSGIMI